MRRLSRSSNPPPPPCETMAIFADWSGSFSSVTQASTSDCTDELAWEARTNRGAPDRYVLLDACAGFAPSPEVVVLITGRIAPGSRFQPVLPPVEVVDPGPRVVIDGVHPIEDKILNPGLDSSVKKKHQTVLVSFFFSPVHK